MNWSDLAVALVTVVSGGAVAWFTARSTARTELDREAARLAEGRQYQALDVLSVQVGVCREECFRDLAPQPPTAELGRALAEGRWNGYQLYVDPVLDLVRHVNTLARALDDDELRGFAGELRTLADEGSADCFDQAVQTRIGVALESLAEAVDARKAARMSLTAS